MKPFLWLALLALAGCAAKPEPVARPAAPPPATEQALDLKRAPALEGSTWAVEVRNPGGQDLPEFREARDKAAATFLSFTPDGYELKHLDEKAKDHLVAKGKWAAQGDEVSLEPGPGGEPMVVLGVELHNTLRLRRAGGGLQVVRAGSGAQVGFVAVSGAK